MIEYMLLGAWLLVLIVLGVLVITTGMPDINDNDYAAAWVVKAIYLVLLSVTMYQMGAHFGGM